jgi:N-acetylglucosamine malate deacetylase 1
MELGKAVALLSATAALSAGLSFAAEPPRTLLAVGAHAGDMEISTGAVLAAERARGSRVVLLHLTPGEGGNPKVAPRDYGEQKRREAGEAARALGAEVLFAPYRDGELPDNEEVRRYVANVIRQVRPDVIFTHWRNSLHRDHSRTHAIVKEAVLVASLASVATGNPPYRGVRAVYYAENWEDKEAFQPYVYFNVGDSLDGWKEAVRKYQLFRGGVSAYPYLDYYESLARVRGAEAGTKFAVAFEVDSWTKKRVLEHLP